jgi:predicted dehydrogenase
VKRVGLGFAGVGWLGESLIQALATSDGLALAGVQDARLELAREVAAKYASPWSGNSFDELLDLAAVDVVVICTPNALHVPQAIQALRAGKHVLVQKPLALSFADARAVVDVAHQQGKLLFVDYTYRFLATIDTLRAALPSIGPVQAVSAEFHNIYGPGAEKTWFFDRRLSGGGALLDLGVHLLDLALWLLQPRTVTLEQAELERGGIEHLASLRARLDGVPFDLSVSWNAPLPATRIAFEIGGAHGRLRWENVQGSFFHFRTRRDATVLLDRETSLRSDTLRALARALATRTAPQIDPRVYDLLDQAYAANPAR